LPVSYSQNGLRQRAPENLSPDEREQRRIERLKYMWFTDATQQEIAEAIGVRWGTKVSKMARELGLPPRRPPILKKRRRRKKADV